MADLQNNAGKRWIVFNRVFFMILLLIVFFGMMDAINLKGVFALDAEYQSQHGWTAEDNIWKIYWEDIQPFIILLWYGILFVIAAVWYLATKDKSEALAIFVVPAILIFFGTQDLTYFIFSGQSMNGVSCWADNMITISVISDMMGESCPTKFSFLISGILGLFVAWFALIKLKYLEWPKRGKRK